MAKQVSIPEETVRKIVELGNLILAFGLVERATHYPDSEQRETDTTHTVMLGVTACAFAAQFTPELDRGKIAEFALVHDLVEAYAGDTVSFGKLGEDAGKKEREAAALVRIQNEYDAVFPWITETIEAYESLSSPEARYVKVFDKVLPKIVHILNKGKTVRFLGHDQNSMHEFHIQQLNAISRSYGHDQEEVMELLAQINEIAAATLFE
ncbi:MAG: hypothetical protein JWL82_607 [Parcubacteria group bacterium]|nr:hypothetical protein [Parcubacteria group bacterium]